MKRKTLYLLDTNTVSFVVPGRSQAARARYAEAEVNGRIAISTITEAEIRFGIAKKPRDRQAGEYMEEFLARTDRLAWDSPAAAAYGILRARISALGMTLGALDGLLAAHAIALGATLVTHDRGLHQADTFLSVVDWATDL